ncbi:hypothetical protein G9272_41050 [Streptomyces asoensis]|uniref:Uncharacterized protein n=2 Tax=Streptomyces asoensis TaxID=249586 RepID=A0A6M4X286_9ACTN|nr:hypothetical protein G9272_41050 [Streptomyces asoensis]
MAFKMRAIRDLAEVTYDDMVKFGQASAATYKRTASGTNVPRLFRVMEFADACHLAAPPEVLDRLRVESRPRDLHTLWANARMEERGTLRLGAPRARLIANWAECSLALKTLYERAGAPPLREVQELAGGPMHLPLSTLARIVNRQALPNDNQQLRAFLLGCRLRKEQLPEWDEAWSRLVGGRSVSI